MNAASSNLPIDSLTGNLLNSTFPILETEATGITISVDELTGLPGETVTVPIRISGATDVVSLSLLLQYDPDVLSIPDPNDATDENEGIKRAGISANWELSEGVNPAANVNSETGEVNISLFKTDTATNPTSDDRILEIDFLIADDATIDETTRIDLQPSQGDSTSRIGIGSEDLLVTDSVLSDGDLTIGDSVFNTQINRFQNSDVPGTFLFADETESISIRANFPNFIEEGPAFKVSKEPADDLIRINRFQNRDVQGTFLFADETESISIRENFPNFVEEGVAFYVYDADADKGIDYYRFQNLNITGTYIFVDEAERDNILENFPNDFALEGVAFEVER